MIGIFYNGEDRYRETSRENHEEFIKILSTKYPVSVYDLTIENINRSNCPYSEVGNIQLWDYAQSIDQLKEKFLIKLRTDLWITPSASRAIIAELENIIVGTQHASFLGYAHKNHFASKYDKYFVLGYENVRDLVIIVNKDKICSSQEISTKLKSLDAVRSGNLMYGKILRDDSISYNVFCQLYLIRKHYDKHSKEWQWQVGKDFLLDWNPKKSRLALEWYETTKNCYDSI